MSTPDNVGEEEDDILELELGSSGRADVKDDEDSKINQNFQVCCMVFQSEVTQAKPVLCVSGRHI